MIIVFSVLFSHTFSILFDLFLPPLSFPLSLSLSISLSPGCGDFKMADLSVLPDPCPLPEKEKKRSLDERERLIYAPMAGIGGVVYDKVTS